MQVKDLSSVKMENLKTEIMSKFTELSDKTFMIQFNNSLIYEFDNAEDDPDEIKLSEKRLLKNFSDLKICHQSTLSI